MTSAPSPIRCYLPLSSPCPDLRGCDWRFEVQGALLCSLIGSCTPGVPLCLYPLLFVVRGISKRKKTEKKTIKEERKREEEERKKMQYRKKKCGYKKGSLANMRQKI